MLLNNTSPIYGVPKGVYYGQNERVDELNNRIYDRNRADGNLEPNFDPRPVPTKYALFPIIDRRAATNERIYKTPNYSVEHQFNPGTSGPVSGFLSKVNTESELRNQYFALQRGAGQDVFIPKSNSDLYVAPTFTSIGPSQPFPELFSVLDYKNMNAPLPQSIGHDRFNNHTRTQLRGLDM
jgi:hypothetical protein